MKLVTVMMLVRLPRLIHRRMTKGINATSLKKILIHPKLADPIIVRIWPPTPPHPLLNGHRKIIPHRNQHHNTTVFQSRRRLGTMPTRLIQPPPPSSTGKTRLPRIIFKLGVRLRPKIHNIGIIGNIRCINHEKTPKNIKKHAIEFLHGHDTEDKITRKQKRNH
jgi:hypothetical protein